MAANRSAFEPITDQPASQGGRWRKFKKILRSPLSLIARCFQFHPSQTTIDEEDSAHVLKTTTPITPTTEPHDVVEVTELTQAATEVQATQTTLNSGGMNTAQHEMMSTRNLPFDSVPTSKSTKLDAQTELSLLKQQAEPSTLPPHEAHVPAPHARHQHQRAVTLPWPQSQRPRSHPANESAPQLCFSLSSVMPSSETSPCVMPALLAQRRPQQSSMHQQSIINGSDVVEIPDYSLTTGWDDPNNLVSCEVGEVLVPKDMVVYANAYNARSLTVMTVLGTGAFGTVVLARDDSGQEVALKAMPSSEGKGQRAKERMSLEIAAQTAVQHRHSVQLLATFSEGQRFFLVLEYACNGSLRRRMQETGGTGLQPSFAARVTLQVASALQVLHSHGFVHRDIKPGNIIFGDSDDAKVCDYGICGIVGTSGVCITYCGTKDYCAPEVDGNKLYDEAVDLWSLGVVIFEMLTGHLPFEKGHSAKISSKIDIPDRLAVNEQALDLIQRLLCVDPKRRLPLSEVVSHPWVVQYADPVDRENLAVIQRATRCYAL